MKKFLLRLLVFFVLLKIVYQQQQQQQEQKSSKFDHIREGPMVGVHDFIRSPGHIVSADEVDSKHVYLDHQKRKESEFLPMESGSLTMSSSLCRNDCGGLSRGRCNTTSSECICKAPYFGVDCGFIECAVKDCHGRGICDVTVGVCVCRVEFYGEGCEYFSCVKNCSNTANVVHGECFNGTCQCFPPWTSVVGHGQAECSVSIDMLELISINTASRYIGTGYVLFMSLVNVLMSFLFVDFHYFGYFILLLDHLQFIGLSGYLEVLSSQSISSTVLISPDGATLSTATYFKFASSFQWSNFVFSIGILDSATEERGPIVFVDNFFLFCILLLVSVILSGFMLFYKYRCQSKSTSSGGDGGGTSGSSSETVTRCLSALLLRLLLLSYSGLSCSVSYEIALAVQGRIVIVAFVAALSLLLFYIIPFPFLCLVFLNRENPNNNRNTNMSSSPTTTIGIGNDLQILENDENSLRQSLDSTGVFRRGGKKVNSSYLSPLHNHFREEFHLFGFVVLMKKFCFSLLIGLFRISNDQIIGLILLMMVYFVIVLICKPFKNPTHQGRYQNRNIAELVVTAGQTAALILEALLPMGGLSVTIALILLQLFIIIYIFYAILASIFVNYVLKLLSHHWHGTPFSTTTTTPLISNHQITAGGGAADYSSTEGRISFNSDQDQNLNNNNNNNNNNNQNNNNNDDHDDNNNNNNNVASGERDLTLQQQQQQITKVDDSQL